MKCLETLANPAALFQLASKFGYFLSDTLRASGTLQFGVPMVLEVIQLTGLESLTAVGLLTQTARIYVRIPSSATFVKAYLAHESSTPLLIILPLLCCPMRLPVSNFAHCALDFELAIIADCFGSILLSLSQSDWRNLHTRILLDCSEYSQVCCSLYI